MIQYSKTGDEPRRTAESYLNQIENAIKVRRKQFDALLDPALLENAGAKEKALRDSVAGNASLASASGAWDEIATAQDTWRNILVRHSFIEGRPRSTASSSPTPARSCAPPPSARSRTRRACRSTQKRAYRRWCRTSRPMRRSTRTSRCCGSPSASSACASGSARTTRSCAACSATIRRIRSPTASCARARSAIAAARVALYEGGQAAIDASQDPMVRLAAAVDPDARALRKQFEEEVDGPTAARPGGDRESALRRVRHEHLPGCDFHASPLLRRDERLERERPGGPAVDRARRALSNARPASRRSRSRRAGWPRRTAST